MPDLTFPMATLVFFQFVFAAITVIILAGPVLGRMNFKAWVIFCPIWMTFVYTIDAFSLWGGGWLATLGAVDFSGLVGITPAAGYGWGAVIIGVCTRLRIIAALPGLRWAFIRPPKCRNLATA